MKILSLFLALILTVSCMLIPASAADDIESGISVADPVLPEAYLSCPSSLLQIYSHLLDLCP